MQIAEAESQTITDMPGEVMELKNELGTRMKTPECAEIAKELTDTASQIRDLDPTEKPASLRPKAYAKITEILITKERPMTAEEIIQEVGGIFSAWKIKNALKKKSTGAKAVFTVNDGRYSLKAAA